MEGAKWREGREGARWSWRERGGGGVLAQRDISHGAAVCIGMGDHGLQDHVAFDLAIMTSTSMI